MGLKICEKCGRATNERDPGSWSYHGHKCIIIPKEQICTYCNIKKPISDFYKQRIGVKEQGDFFNYGHICTDCYWRHNLIPHQIAKQFNINLNKVKEHPELIEAWLKQVETKRLLKQKKHENIKTS
jgi:hypothetical protein